MDTGPFVPCDACPRPSGSWCCARRHRGYCDKVRAARTAVAAGAATPTDLYWLNFVATEDGPPPSDPPVAAPAPAQPPLPSLAAQAIAFARAQVRHIADGRAKVTPEVAAARVAACEACDRFRPADRRCSAAGCGCYIDRKATYRSESCPLGRWPAPEPEETA